LKRPSLAAYQAPNDIRGRQAQGAATNAQHRRLKL
jgi:hypothetical protein